MVDKKAILEKLGGEEIGEESLTEYRPTGYPKPIKRYKTIWELYNLSIEGTYFWTLDILRDGWGFVDIEKLEDVFSAAEHSAFFGVAQQRIGLQQDKVSQFLATIGKMVKEMFQLVRELRIIDERLEYYKQSHEGIESADITLKGIYIDMVEGGAKNPASVYGMAREVQFTSLPDLFFSTHTKNENEVDDVVETERAGFNKSVRNVLKRKLKTYMVWKEKTHDELFTRRRFTLQYLRQHFDIIKMYMDWVRPYLRNIQKLTMRERDVSADLIGAFEGSMVEIEFLAKKLPYDIDTNKKNKKIYSVVIAHFLYRTRPSMSFQQEGYQRGPIHVGRMETTLRCYAWDQKKIDAYKKLKQLEDFELMKVISASVKAAMVALGDELMAYLEQAGEEKVMKEKEKELGVEKPKGDSVVTPFVAGAKGVGDMFGAMFPKKSGKKTSKEEYRQLQEEKALANSDVKTVLWETYKNFKKAHGFIAW